MNQRLSKKLRKAAKKDMFKNMDELLTALCQAPLKLRLSIVWRLLRGKRR